MAHGWFLDCPGLTSPPIEEGVGSTWGVEIVDFIERIPMPRAKNWHEAAQTYRSLLQQALEDLDDVTSSGYTTRAWLDAAARRLEHAQQLRLAMADVEPLPAARG